MSDQRKSNLNCKHCAGGVNVGDEKCSHCGMPLAPDFGKHPRKKFVVFFIALVIFCVMMIIWLPPNWARFIQ